jgi:hypothetical protein
MYENFKIKQGTMLIFHLVFNIRNKKECVKIKQMRMTDKLKK